MSNFNHRLRQLRQEKGISQQELADEIGLSKSSINMYERGEREPGIDTIKQISVIFNVDVDYLLGKTDTKQITTKIKYKVSKSIGKNIQVLREKRDMSTQRFAELLKVKESVVLEIESGKRTLDKEMLFRICDILSTTPDFLDGVIAERLENGDWDAEYRYERQQNSPEELKLSEGEKVLIDLFRKVPEDQKKMVLQMIRAALSSQVQ